jgi:hypothetical protein
VRYTSFYNDALYQVGWFACVLGAAAVGLVVETAQIVAGLLEMLGIEST